jgi:hypothetical protein
VASAQTIFELTTILRVSARSAGETDLDETVYTLEEKHLAIQGSLNEFIRATKCTRQTDTIDVDTGTYRLDFSDIDGFHSERLIGLWIDQKDPVEAVDIEDVLQKRRTRASDTGSPLFVGFDEPQTAMFWPIADTNYSLNVQWWPPLTSFTAGDEDANDIEVNVPGDLAATVVRTAGVVWLQGSQIENLPILDPLRVAYETAVKRAMGAGGLAGRSIIRTSSRERWDDEGDFPPDREP